jgi:hypothetical protein
MRCETLLPEIRRSSPTTSPLTPPPPPDTGVSWSSAEKLNPHCAPRGMWRLNITFDRTTLSITFTANNWTKYAGTTLSLRGRRSMSGWHTYLLFAVRFRTTSNSHSDSHAMDTGVKAVGWSSWIIHHNVMLRLTLSNFISTPYSSWSRGAYAQGQQTCMHMVDFENKMQ